MFHYARNIDTKPQRRSCGVPIVTVFCLIGLVAAVVALGPRVLDRLQNWDGALPWNPECTVEISGDEIGLTRDEAKLATTAVALSAGGAEAPDTSELDDAVLQRLADGPVSDAGPSLSCRVSTAEDLSQQEPTDSGLTPRAEQVRDQMTEVFGDLSMGGFAPGGVDHGHQEGSTHYDGRAIDIFFRPVSEENRREGWQLAHWLIAHADDLDIQYVIFDDQVWSAHSFGGQWHDYEVADPDSAVLRHLDHVHVDVLGGDASDGSQGRSPIVRWTG